MLMGMIILQEVSDMVTRHDLLKEYQHINEIYNGHMNLLLVLFGVGITVVGILLPIFITYIQNKRFDKEIEKLKVDLRKDIIKVNKKRINKEVLLLKKEFKNNEPLLNR